MTGPPELLLAPEVPPVVLALLRAAVLEGLLDDADPLAAGLERAGWQRERSGGHWTCAAHPAWSVQSSARPPGLGVFAAGERRVLAGAFRSLTRHLGSGGPGRALSHELDPDALDWPTWTTAEVEVSLNLSPFTWKPLPDHLQALSAPCSLHLHVSRTDEPRDGSPPDHERALRLARHGSPVERWYLAAQDDLTDDVVEVLQRDDDPAVVASLAEGARQRAVFREQHAEEEAELRGERGGSVHLAGSAGGADLDLAGADLAAVVALYRAVGWTEYADDPARLAAALAGSSRVVVARRGGEVVGLARVVSDGATTAYLQDILVHPDHQRCGIGAHLVRSALRPYAGVHQQVLLTDDEPRQRAFCTALGFTEVGEHPAGPLRAFLRVTG